MRILTSQIMQDIYLRLQLASFWKKDKEFENKLQWNLESLSLFGSVKGRSYKEHWLLKRKAGQFWIASSMIKKSMIFDGLSLARNAEYFVCFRKY